MATTPHEEDGGRQRFLDLLEVSPEQAAVALSNAHSADAAVWLVDVDEEDAWRVFSILDAESQAGILEDAEDELTATLVGQMSSPDLREVVEELPSDEAVDLLAEADDRVVEDVLSNMDAEAADELRELIAYDPESAGGIMATEVITVQRGQRLGDVVKEIKKLGDEAEEDLGIFVVDPGNRPVGYLSDRDLLTHSIHETVNVVMVDPFVVAANVDQEDAARVIDRYGLQSLAVVNDEGAVVGVISAEDASEIRTEEADEDIARMVGTSTGHQTRLPVLTRVRQRMPLMGLTVLGGLLSAKLLALFTGGGDGPESMATSDILRYLPLIIGLAGNVGIQSSTILIRGYATGEIEKQRQWRAIGGEIAVGLTIGLLCWLAVLLTTSGVETGQIISSFGMAVGAATPLAVALASLLGCLVPVGCSRLNLDPAIVAGPFLISFSDVTGSLIYIVIARALLL
ncbi:MAG: magnesium transporter [Planctomycetota bacterium]|nr:magnesium transporter [Planctomycetota bacterium]